MYPFAAKCLVLAAYQGIDYDVIKGFYLLSSYSGLGNTERQTGAIYFYNMKILCGLSL